MIIRNIFIILPQNFLHFLRFSSTFLPYLVYNFRKKKKYKCQHFSVFVMRLLRIYFRFGRLRFTASPAVRDDLSVCFLRAIPFFFFILPRLPRHALACLWAMEIERIFWTVLSVSEDGSREQSLLAQQLCRIDKYPLWRPFRWCRWSHLVAFIEWAFLARTYF